MLLKNHRVRGNLSVSINIATTTKTAHSLAHGAIYPLQTERVDFVRVVMGFSIVRQIIKTLD